MIKHYDKMAFKYIGKKKYLDDELKKQIRVGDIVEKKKLKDSYYLEIEQSLEELHTAKTKVQIVKAIEAKEASIKHLQKEVKVLKELYEPTEMKTKRRIKN